MPDEQTPLLDDARPGVDPETHRAEVDHEAVYKRFTESRKLFIVFMVSWGGLIPCEWSTTVELVVRTEEEHSVCGRLFRALHTSNCSGIWDFWCRYQVRTLNTTFILHDCLLSAALRSAYPSLQALLAA